ncbi:MAG: hypothetical protein EOP85_15580, partial [Verrucomicrobiaceae bacterium]
IRITVLEAKALKSPTVETEHLMLSILKNKEAVATQILHQYEVDYERFKNELAILQGHTPSAEYGDPGGEDGGAASLFVTDLHRIGRAGGAFVLALA